MRRCECAFCPPRSASSSASSSSSAGVGSGAEPVVLVGLSRKEAVFFVYPDGALAKSARCVPFLPSLPPLCLSSTRCQHFQVSSLVF